MEQLQVDILSLPSKLDSRREPVGSWSVGPRRPIFTTGKNIEKEPV